MEWEAAVQHQLNSLASKVEAEIDRRLIASDMTNLDEVIWTVAINTEEGLIVVGIDGNGKIVNQLYDAKASSLSPDIQRLTRRMAMMVTQRLLPIILRLIPRPSFIPAGAPTSEDH